VADECVHSLHGSLCHLWVRHRPQNVHKEQLGGSGKHPACAQAAKTWRLDTHVACTLSLTSHLCCNCPAAVAARLQHKCASTKVSRAALLSGALLIKGTCTASQHLVCLCCVQLIGYIHHMTWGMNQKCCAAVVCWCCLQLNDAIKRSNGMSMRCIDAQIMLYFLWGNVLCAGSLSFSAICRQARPAVLVAVIWVIMSGFGANLVLTQFIEQGPSVAATILQIIPSMGLFRGKSSITNLPIGGLVRSNDTVLNHCM